MLAHWRFQSRKAPGGACEPCCLIRLEELNEARQGVVERVKAAEKERAGLEGAKAVAEAYLGKQRECTASEAAIFQIFIRDGQVNHIGSPYQPSVSCLDHALGCMVWTVLKTTETCSSQAMHLFDCLVVLLLRMFCGCHVLSWCMFLSEQLHHATSVYGPPPGSMCASLMQRNIDKIAGNLAELEAKLKHEQDKHAAYSADLKAAEERCVPVLMAVCMHDTPIVPTSLCGCFYKKRRSEQADSKHAEKPLSVIGRI